MNRARGARRLWGFLGPLLLVLAALPGVAGAEHWIHGYCTEDDQPVITYWPPGWEEIYEARCAVGQLIRYNPLPDGYAIIDTTPLPRPADFGGWAYIWLNQRRVVNPYRDVEPYVVRSTSRTLIPLRYVTEALGAEVQWDQATRTAAVTWQGRRVEITIGQDTGRIDGRSVALDQPALLWRDRTMVPLRFLAEAIGAEVTWDQAAFQVDITLPGAVCLPAYCPN